MSTGGIFSYHHDPRPVEIVYDEERIKVLIDETRKRILSVLSNTEVDMSVSEIADHLGTNPQRIYHHVDKLVECNFLVKTREERKKRSVTSYYARTAQAFIVSYSTDRGYIHDQQLSTHFIDNFKTLLNMDFSHTEELELRKMIRKLAAISEKVFLNISNSSEEEIPRHTVENLYFLLEYLIFFSNPQAREILSQFNELVLPKLSETRDGIRTLRL
ncbi:MAG: ArsR/SmtB family transcription factor [Candidatus Kariarchaeaceae archaeon]